MKKKMIKKKKKKEKQKKKKEKKKQEKKEKREDKNVSKVKGSQNQNKKVSAIIRFKKKYTHQQI